MLFRFSAPVLANWRMKNVCELAPFLRRLENHRAKCAPIQLSICIKNVIAKFLANFGEHGLVMMRERPRKCSCVEKLRLRQKVTQAIYKSRFPRGNSAGDPDRWHGRRVAQTSCLWGKRASCAFLVPITKDSAIVCIA